MWCSTICRSIRATWTCCAHGHPLASLPRQPRSELRRRRTITLARETWKRCLRAAPLCLPVRPAHLHSARQCPLRRPPGGWQQRRLLRRIRRHAAAVREQPSEHVPREHLIVLSMHIPLVSQHGDANPADSTADRRALLELLSGRPHTLSLSGHMHTTEHHYLGAEAGFSGAQPHHHHVLTAASGSWWCGPRDRRGIPCADSVDGTPNGLPYPVGGWAPLHDALRAVRPARVPASCASRSAGRSVQPKHPSREAARRFHLPSRQISSKLAKSSPTYSTAGPRPL